MCPLKWKPLPSTAITESPLAFSSAIRSSPITQSSLLSPMSVPSSRFDEPPCDVGWWINSLLTVFFWTLDAPNFPTLGICEWMENFPKSIRLDFERRNSHTVPDGDFISNEGSGTIHSRIMHELNDFLFLSVSLCSVPMIKTFFKLQRFADGERKLFFCIWIVFTPTTNSLLVKTFFFHSPSNERLHCARIMRKASRLFKWKPDIMSGGFAPPFISLSIRRFSKLSWKERIKKCAERL